MNEILCCGNEINIFSTCPLSAAVKKQSYQTIFIMRTCLMRNNTLRIIPDLSLLHTSDSPLMTMREIGCSDEGDWGLDEGGFYGCPLGRLIK